VTEINYLFNSDYQLCPDTVLELLIPNSSPGTNMNTNQCCIILNYRCIYPVHQVTQLSICFTVVRSICVGPPSGMRLMSPSWLMEF
jgi:hypothetical protein